MLLYRKPEGEKSLEEFVWELLLVRLNVGVIASTHIVSLELSPTAGPNRRGLGNVVQCGPGGEKDSGE